MSAFICRRNFFHATRGHTSYAQVSAFRYHDIYINVYNVYYSMVNEEVDLVAEPLYSLDDWAEVWRARGSNLGPESQVSNRQKSRRYHRYPPIWNRNRCRK